MKVRHWLRTALCALAICMTWPSYAAHGAPRATAAAAPSPAGVPAGWLSTSALGTTPADVLPQAFVASAAQWRALPLQIAEQAAPAFQDAAGGGGAAAALLAQTLLGQNIVTPDPRALAQNRLSAVLGPLAQTLGVATSAASTTSGSSGLAADLVDPASGVLHVTYQDFSVPARGQPMALQRTFVSGNTAASAMGNGWAFTYGIHLAYDASGNPLIEEAAGGVTHFAFWQAPSTYIALDAPGWEVLWLHPGGATQLMADGSSHQFDALGRLVRLQDRDGIGLTINYRGANLASVVDAAGRSLRFTENSAGLISTITDPMGAVIRYGHDGAGNLISVTTAAGATTRYAYSTPTSDSYDTARLTGITLPRGGTIHFSYDSGARVSRVAGPGTMNTAITYADNAAPGTVRTDLVDATGAHTEIDTFNTSPLTTGVQLPVVTRLVDATGRTTTVTSGPSGVTIEDGEGRMKPVASNAGGPASTIQAPQTGANRLGYDQATSTLSMLTGISGRPTTLVYDAAGHLAGIRDATGALTKVEQIAPLTFHVVSPNSGVAILQFDAAGNVIALTDAMGRKTTFLWDPDGRLTGISDPAHGRLTFRYGPSGALLARTDALGAVTSYSYDADGDLTSMRDALGDTWRFTYDAFDLPVSVVDPLGDTDRLSYDDAGRLTMVTDPLGAVTRAGYDGAGRVASVTDPLGHTTRYRYGAAGELVAATSPAGRTTRYSYDAAGQPVVVTDADGSSTTLMYDDAGRLTASRAGAGPTTEYRYDAVGRLTQRTVPDESGASYTYDAAGYLVSAGNGSGTIRDAYDAAGDLTSTVDTSGHTIRYSYDAAGRRATMTSATGTVTRYAYDAAGHISAIDDPLGSSTFRYDVRGERVAATLPGGIAVSYLYDKADRLTALTYKHGATVVARFVYGYDRDGNVVQEQALGDTLRYRYDAANRLTAMQGSTRSDDASYAYDADGNLLSSASRGALRYDAAGRLLTAGSASMAYDPAGRAMTGLAGAIYGYDQSGNLLAAHTSGADVMYGEDALGRIVTRLEAGNTTLTVYDGSDPVAAFGPIPSVVARNVYGPWIDEPLAFSANGQTYTYVVDRLGSVRMVLDGAGTPVATLRYDAYGRLLGKTGSGPTTLGFAGRPYDPATGLIDLRDRLYDPALARFLSPDPLARPGAADYPYAADSPATRSDPLGLCAESSGEGPSNSTLGVFAAESSGLPELLGETFGQAFSGYGAWHQIEQFNAANAAFGDGCKGVNNTDPTFIDAAGVAATDRGSEAGNSTLALTRGASGGSVEALFPVAAAGTVTIGVYDAHGHLTRALAAQPASPPVLDITWDGRDTAGHEVADGTYYMLETEQPAAAGAQATCALRTIAVTAGASGPFVVPVLSVPPATSSVSAKIVTPVSGALVRGLVPIDGVASGSDFDHYQLDYGPGTSPTRWTGIRATVSGTAGVPDKGPVTLALLHTLSGNLGSLDTGLSDYFYYRSSGAQGLSGLYTIRLRVFGRHGEVAQALAWIVVGRVATYVQDATIASPSGLASLAVPSMAIHDIAQVFAVLPLTSTEPIPAQLRPLSRVYALHPSGYVFSIPATLSMHISTTAPGAAIYAWDAGTNRWQPLRTSVAGAKHGTTLSTPVARLNQAPALYAVFAPIAAPAPPLLFPLGAAPSGATTVTLAAATRPGLLVQVLSAGRPTGVPVVAGADGLAVIPGIHLQSGQNRFTAVARDSAGHISAPSQAISVTAAPKTLELLDPATTLPAKVTDLAAVPRPAQAGPPPPVVNSPTLHAVLAAEFHRPQDLWPGRTAPLGASTTVVTDGGHTALEITAGGTGDLTTGVPVSSFNLATHPLITFSYKVPPTVSVDLAIHANGTWWVAPLSDPPPTANDFARVYFFPLGDYPSLKLVRDNRWHDITLNLYQLIRDQQPTGPVVVDRMAFGDWEPSGWLGVRPSSANAPATSFLLDHVALPAVSRISTASFSWSEPAGQGISAYSYLLDQKPSTVPPARSMGLAPATTVGPLPTGGYWLHVRARGRTGVWGAAANYPFVIDTLPLRVGTPQPGPGGTGTAFVTVPISDPGASGVDASTIRLQVFGKTYGPGSDIVSYDLSAGAATLNIGYIQPAPQNLFPGGKVPVVLLAASDAAGNSIVRPIAWTYTLDIPTALPGGAQLLTTRGGDSPTFSPDGTRVAFISHRIGAAHVWTIDAGDLGEKHGTARQIVSGPGVDADPAWSPTGDVIAFDSTRNGSRQLYLVQPNGAGLRQISSSAGGAMQPTWSPDGKQIAFVSDGNLMVVNRDGSGLRTVIADGEHAVRDPSWSPDGRVIAFRHSLYVDQIWTVRPDGTHDGILTSLASGESQSSPAWLADGRVAYVSLREKVSALYAVEPDGTEQNTLAGQPPAQLFTPAASRDGSTIAFVSTLAGGHNIFVSRQFRIEPLDVSAESFDPTAGHAVAIRYGLTSSATVSIGITDSNEHTVRTLVVHKLLPAGVRQLTWDGRDDRGRLLGEGVYSVQVAGQAPGLPVLKRGLGVTIDDVSQHGTLVIAVTDKGRPAGGAALTVLRAGTQSYVEQDMTGRTGSSTISLSPGIYDVLAQADNGDQGVASNLVVRRHGALSHAIKLAVPAVPSPGASATAPVSSPAVQKSATPIGSATAASTPTATTAAAAGTPAASATSPASKGNTGTLVVSVQTSPGHSAIDAGVDVYLGSRLISYGGTDSTGVITFTVSPGTYSIQIRLAAATATISTVKVSLGRVTRQTVTLGSGTLKVQVDLVAGRPAVDADVEVYRGSTLVSYGGTDSTGRITFTLNAGSYAIQASLGKATGPVVTATVEGGAVALSTVVLNAGQLVVKVLTKSGAPAVGAEVDISQGGTLLAYDDTDSTGAVTFTLNAGTYTVQASLGGATNKSLSVHVSAGGTSSYTTTLGR